MEEIQSLLTAIQLQLEDLDDLCPNIKGKSRVPCDEEIAIAHFKLDLIAFKAQMEDLRQAESIKIAQETDAELLEEFQRLDVLERQDHEYAEHLSMNAEVMMTPIRIPTPIPISTPTSSKNVRINAAAGPSCVSESSSDSATDMRSFELTPDEYADIPGKKYYGTFSSVFISRLFPLLILILQLLYRVSRSKQAGVCLVYGTRRNSSQDGTLRPFLLHRVHVQTVQSGGQR